MKENYILQEGQHPLTGQRAANFRLMVNQWAERRLMMLIFAMEKLNIHHISTSGSCTYVTTSTKPSYQFVLPK